MEIGIEIILLVIFGIVCLIFGILGFQGAINKKNAAREIMKTHGFDEKNIIEARIILEWVDKHGNSLKNRVFNLMFSSDGQNIGLQYQNFSWLEDLKKFSLNEVTFSISNQKDFWVGAAIGAGLMFGAVAGLIAGGAIQKNNSYMQVKTPNEVFTFRLAPRDIEIFTALSLRSNNFTI